MRRPAYLDLPDALFIEKIETLESFLESCNLCPRGCGVNRLRGETGFCRTGALPVVSSWGPHFGEERPITGLSGSGTIFFTYCNLGCIYCQNYTISHLGEGMEISVERLSEIMLSLERQGCHNINLVSPTHQTPMIARALFLAHEQGLSIPIVYNTGGYDSLEVLRLLEGLVDIYMPDLKYADPEVSEKLSSAPDYPEVAKEAIREMHRQVGDLVIDQYGVAERGLLVRHLVLPDGLSGTEEVVRFLKDEISENTYLNIMDQYHPCYRAFDFPSLKRRITPSEYSDAIEVAKAAGMRRIDGVTV